jgi:hypothetical protein
VRDFSRPGDAPHWLPLVLNSIREALGDIWPRPIRVKDYTSTTLPDPGPFKQGLVYVSDEEGVAYSNGHEWLRFLTDTAAPYESHLFDISRDETTVLTAGTGKYTFRTPYAFLLGDHDGGPGFRASLTTASSSGAVTIDVNVDGATILSTKLTIDANEKSSVTATPSVVTDDQLDDDVEITVDVDGAGTGAVGLKMWMIGRRFVEPNFLLLEGDMTDGDDLLLLEGDATDGDDLLVLEAA